MSAMSQIKASASKVAIAKATASEKVMDAVEAKAKTLPDLTTPQGDNGPVILSDKTTADQHVAFAKEMAGKFPKVAEEAFEGVRVAGTVKARGPFQCWAVLLDVFGDKVWELPEPGTDASMVAGTNAKPDKVKYQQKADDGSVKTIVVSFWNTFPDSTKHGQELTKRLAEIEAKADGSDFAEMSSHEYEDTKNSAKEAIKYNRTVYKNAMEFGYQLQRLEELDLDVVIYGADSMKKPITVCGNTKETIRYHENLSASDVLRLDIPAIKTLGGDIMAFRKWFGRDRSDKTNDKKATTVQVKDVDSFEETIAALAQYFENEASTKLLAAKLAKADDAYILSLYDVSVQLDNLLTQTGNRAEKLARARNIALNEQTAEGKAA